MNVSYYDVYARASRHPSAWIFTFISKGGGNSPFRMYGSECFMLLTNSLGRIDEDA